MNWLPHQTQARLGHLTDCRRYSVSAIHPTDGHEPWWEARDSTGREIAAGYGDAGLAKCKSFCEIDARRDLPIEHDSPTELTRVEIHAPSSNNEPAQVPTTSAQTALF